MLIYECALYRSTVWYCCSMLLPSTALFKACSYQELLDLAVSVAFLHRGEPGECHMTKSHNITDSVQLYEFWLVAGSCQWCFSYKIVFTPPAFLVTYLQREGKPNYDRQHKIGRATQVLLNLRLMCNVILCYQCIPVHELLIVLGRVIVVVWHEQLLKFLFIVLCTLVVLIWTFLVIIMQRILY